MEPWWCRVGNKEKQIDRWFFVKVQIITPPPPPTSQYFGNLNKGTIFFIWVFYSSCWKATHNVNSSTWTKNLVTQLDNTYNITVFTHV